MNTIENINIDNIDILNKIKNNKMLVIGVVSFIVLLLIIIIISITFFNYLTAIDSEYVLWLHANFQLFFLGHLLIYPHETLQPNYRCSLACI